MLRVIYTVLQQNGGYFDSSFGNWLPDEEEVKCVAEVKDMTEFDAKYPYAESIIKTETI